MKQQRIGAMIVDLVADMDGLFLSHDLFPAATPDILRSEAEKLGHRFFDLERMGYLLAVNSFVIRAGGRTILVDTCVGNDKVRGMADLHQRQGDYLDRLARAGVEPDAVDAVMCTHMHSDHVGWNTRLVGGRWVPTFPNAEYLMVEREYRYWREQSLTATSPVAHGAFEDSVLPVVAAGQARMIGTDHVIAPGIGIVPAPGHTPGCVYLTLEQDGERMVLGGDVIHHPVQLSHPYWSTRACVDPDQSRRTRIGLINELAASGVLLATPHFLHPTAGRVQRDGAAFRFEFLQA